MLVPVVVVVEVVVVVVVATAPPSLLPVWGSTIMSMCCDQSKHSHMILSPFYSPGILWQLISADSLLSHWRVIAESLLVITKGA